MNNEPDIFGQVVASLSDEQIKDKWFLYALNLSAEAVKAWVNNSYLGVDLESVDVVTIELPGGVKVYFWLIDSARMTAPQAIQSLATSGIHAVLRSAGELSAVYVPAVDVPQNAKWN